MGVSHIALHPKIALQNAEKYLVLNETEKDCILNRAGSEPLRQALVPERLEAFLPALPAVP